MNYLGLPKLLLWWLFLFKTITITQFLPLFIPFLFSADSLICLLLCISLFVFILILIRYLIICVWTWFAILYKRLLLFLIFSYWYFLLNLLLSYLLFSLIYQWIVCFFWLFLFCFIILLTCINCFSFLLLLPAELKTMYGCTLIRTLTWSQQWNR